MRFSVVVVLVVGTVAVGLGGCTGTEEDAREDVGAAPTPTGVVADEARERVRTAASEMIWDGPQPTGVVADEAAESLGAASSAWIVGPVPVGRALGEQVGTAAPAAKRPGRGSR